MLLKTWQLEVQVAQAAFLAQVSLKPGVQITFNIVTWHVLPVERSAWPLSEPLPAHIPDFANLTIHQVFVVLDGVHDAVTGLTESIECSKSIIAEYQQVILEEKNNVQIV